MVINDVFKLLLIVMPFALSEEVRPHCWATLALNANRKPFYFEVNNMFMLGTHIFLSVCTQPFKSLHSVWGRLLFI